MSNVWNKIKLVYNWCVANPDIVVIIIAVILWCMFARNIINMIKNIFSGFFATIKSIFDLITYPFRKMKKIVSSFSKKSKNDKLYNNDIQSHY